MNALILLLGLHMAPPAVLTPAQSARQAEAEKLIARADAEWTAGRHAEGCVLGERALTLERDLFGEVRASRHPWLDGLARARQMLGQHERAVKARQEIFDGFERWRGASHWLAAWPRLDLEDAREAARRTSAQADALARADVLVSEAERHRKARVYEAAIKAARQAAGLTREAVGEKHTRHASALSELGLTLYEAGDWKAALTPLRQAHAVRVATLGAGHPDTLGTLFHLALALAAKGDTESALPLMRRVLAGMHAAHGASSPEYGDGLTGVASVLRAAGEHRRCLPLLARAASAARAAHGERAAEFAVALNNLAVMHVEVGDPRAALPLYLRALGVMRATVGERHPHFAAALFNIAALMAKTGDELQALGLYERALRIRRESLGRRHPLVAETLCGLARLHMNLGQSPEALALYREALALTPEGAPQHTDTLIQLAEVHMRMRDNAAALEAGRRALTAAGRHPRRGEALVALAKVHRAMGEPDRALTLVREALGIYYGALGARHPKRPESLLLAATLWSALGRPEEAARLADQALDVLEARGRDHATFQSERQQLDATKTFHAGLDIRLSLDVPGAYRHVLAARGAVLLGQQRRRLFARLAGAERPEVRELTFELRSATRRLVSAPADADLIGRKEALEGRLATLAADFRRGQERPTPEGVAAALPEGAVLVDYFFHRRIDNAGRHSAEYRLTAFVLSKGAAAARFDLGPAPPVEAAVAAWRKAAARGEDAAAEGAALRKLLLAPLAKRLAGAKTLLVCPDRAIAAVPLGALPGEKPGSYLLEEMAVAVLPSPGALVGGAGAEGGAPSLLAVGGVDFGKRKWTPLPGTGREADTVAAAFRVAGGTAASLSGKRATKAAVAGAMEAAGYCHLATHGYFSPGGRGVEGLSPLLASGLVLAEGADDAEGALTALEVAELDLSRCRLAVLSACETGLGVEASGEGLLGMQRAFQIAGARSVVASLWKVPDGATATLMERFYANLWRKGMTKLEALREAQLFVLNHGRRHPEVVRGLTLPSGTTTMKPKDGRTPPFHWAAWALSGDWR